MSEIKPLLVDYHCHLDLYPDFEDQFRTCTTKRIATFAVTTTPLAWPRNRELAANSSMVRVGLGIHPQLVGPDIRELSLFEKYLQETRFVGEVGLDASPAYYRTYKEQKAVFESIVRMCAQAGGKILSVHMVRAARDVLDLIETHLAGTSNRVVLHWFTGSEAEARRAVELGCYFSLNEAMLRTSTGSRLFVNIPRQRLLTETDGPFTRTGNRPSIPKDVCQTTTLLAKSLNLERGATVDLLLSNLSSLEKSTMV